MPDFCPKCHHELEWLCDSCDEPYCDTCDGPGCPNPSCGLDDNSPDDNPCTYE